MADNIKKYGMKFYIGNPDNVWGYPEHPDSYIWAVASAMANYSLNTDVIYNSSLKAFMLKPLPGTTNMSLLNWDVVAGNFKTLTPPDLTGTFARQYNAVDWGYKSKTNIITADGSFSVYIRRPKMKIRPADEYQTIEINTGLGVGDYSVKFKFYLNGTIEFLHNGTVTGTTNVSAEDLQTWKESNVIILDFYTIGNQKIVITSPLFKNAIVTDRYVNAPGYIQINGKYAALVGVSIYTFPTSGSMVWNSMSVLTDGSDESAITPELRIFPPPAVGSTVTATYDYPADGLFKATLTINSTGTNPVLIQAAEFGFKHAWVDPDTFADWYEITAWVNAMSVSVGEEINDRQIKMNMLFLNNTEISNFSSYYNSCSSNPFVPAAAFKIMMTDLDTDEEIPQLGGLMRTGTDTHTDGEFYATECTVLSRLNTNLCGDALTFPIPVGKDIETWWKDALAVAGFFPDNVTCLDSGTFPDTGWDYDKLERGEGKTAGEYLRGIAQSRGFIMDDATEDIIAIRPTQIGSPVIIPVTTEFSITTAQMIEGIAVDFGNPEYFNSVSIIEDTDRAQWIYRAYCPDAIAQDKRIINNVINRTDLNQTGEAEATIELKKCQEKCYTCTVDIPAFGITSFWIGTAAIGVTTTQNYAMGNPNGKIFPLTDINLNYNNHGTFWTITGTVTGKTRQSTMPTIVTEKTFYPLGGEAAKSREINNGAWKQKEKIKKEKPKKKPHSPKAKKLVLAKWQKM